MAAKEKEREKGNEVSSGKQSPASFTAGAACDRLSSQKTSRNNVKKGTNGGTEGKKD